MGPEPLRLVSRKGWSQDTEPAAEGPVEMPKLPHESAHSEPGTRGRQPCPSMFRHGRASKQRLPTAWWKNVEVGIRQ